MSDVGVIGIVLFILFPEFPMAILLSVVFAPFSIYEYLTRCKICDGTGNKPLQYKNKVIGRETCFHRKESVA